MAKKMINKELTLFPFVSRIGIDIDTKRFMTDNFHCLFVSIPRIII